MLVTHFMCCIKYVVIKHFKSFYINNLYIFGISKISLVILKTDKTFYLIGSNLVLLFVMFLGFFLIGGVNSS